MSRCATLVAMEYKPPRVAVTPAGLRIRERFRRTTGLLPYGPHMGLARELLSDIMRTCTLCEGTGTFGTSGGMGWMKCPACLGLGEVYAISDKELQRHRQRVLEQYPNARIRDWEPLKVVRHPIWNRRECVVVDGDTGERLTATELV